MSYKNLQKGYKLQCNPSNFQKIFLSKNYGLPLHHNQ